MPSFGNGCTLRASLLSLLLLQDDVGNRREAQPQQSFPSALNDDARTLGRQGVVSQSDGVFSDEVNGQSIHSVRGRHRRPQSFALLRPLTESAH